MPPCSGPWGTWPSSSSAPPDPISHRPASHRPADTRQIGAVTGWWWGPSSCCSTAASSPPRSPVPRTRPPATAASPRPTHQVIAAARPRIEATLQRPLGDMAIIQQRAPGSAPAPPGWPRRIGAVTGWGGPRAVAALQRAHPLDHRSPEPGHRLPPPPHQGMAPQPVKQVLSAEIFRLAFPINSLK